MKFIETHTIDSIKDMYLLGNSTLKIAKELEISTYTISKYLKLSNIKPRFRKYSLDESYFSNIDSFEKSYLLGYLFADGCVRYNEKTRAYGLKLKLHKKDEHILEFLKSEVGSNAPIKDESNSNCSYITLNSKEFADNLIKLGCTVNKSLTLKFPNLDDKYLNSFIHGYFDGDGNIYFNKGQRHFKLLGTYDFLTSISEYFKLCGIEGKVSEYPNSRIHQYRISNRTTLEKIYNLFYSDNYIFLNRKEVIFKDCIKNNKLI